MRIHLKIVALLTGLLVAGCATTKRVNSYKVTGSLASPDGQYVAEYGPFSSYCECGRKSTEYWAVVATPAVTESTGGTIRTIKFSEAIELTEWATVADGKPEEHIKWAPDSKSVTFYITSAPFTVHIEELKQPYQQRF